jgi:hypothetical protein
LENLQVEVGPNVTRSVMITDERETTVKQQIPIVAGRLKELTQQEKVTSYPVVWFEPGTNNEYLINKDNGLMEFVSIHERAVKPKPLPEPPVVIKPEVTLYGKKVFCCKLRAGVFISREGQKAVNVKLDGCIEKDDEFMFTPTTNLSDYWVAAPTSLVKAHKKDGVRVMIDNPSTLPIRLEKDLIIGTLEPYQAIKVIKGNPDDSPIEKLATMVTDVRRQLKEAIAQPKERITRQDRLFHLQRQKDQGKISQQEYQKLLEGSLQDDNEKYHQ